MHTVQSVEEQIQARVTASVTAQIAQLVGQVTPEQVAQLILSCARFKAEAEVYREQVDLLMGLTPAGVSAESPAGARGADEPGTGS